MIMHTISLNLWTCPPRFVDAKGLYSPTTNTNFTERFEVEAMERIDYALILAALISFVGLVVVQT